MTDNILITGFGPFSEHKVNASWEAVKLLPNQLNGFNIIKEEVPVEYSYVENHIPRLWETLNPILVLHVGVSSMADKFVIEKCAFRKGYTKTDCSGIVKSSQEACPDGEECINTGIDIDEICQRLNNNKQFQTCTSTNAGRYLCEYTFYTSLNIDRRRTLFVHVPPINQPYTTEQVAEGLLEIITASLEQIRGKVCEANEVKNI